MFCQYSGQRSCALSCVNVTKGGTAAQYDIALLADGVRGNSSARRPIVILF